MASVIPVATQAISLFQTVATIAKVFDDSDVQRDDQALRQLEQQQKLQQQQSAQDAAIQKEQIATNAKLAEDKRRVALKRAVARQRAQFGGRGVASGDGSSEAVLLGLFEESDAERESRERLDKLRTQVIDQNLAQQSRVNTLQRTQIAARNSLSNQSNTLDDISTILGAF